MKIEIWSDYVCPFCYIGLRRYEAALANFAHRDELETVFKSFELNPDADRDDNPPAAEMLMAKYGMSREQVEANLANLTEQAKSVGLDYRLAEAVQTNTFDAHRLTYFAAEHGKMDAMAERLLKAHFTEVQHVGDRETLANLAAEVGLDRDKTLDMLASGEFADDVRADQEEARRLGIQGVPFFVIDRKYAVSGAQPAEVFLQALETAWAERDDA